MKVKKHTGISKRLKTLETIINMRKGLVKQYRKQRQATKIQK